VRAALLICLSLVSSSCASLGGKDCTIADWREAGFEDGIAGAPENAFDRRCERCATKPGFAADFTAYTEGRAAGLAEYCRAETGFSVGARGEAYHGVCAAEDSVAFVAAYARGSRLFELEREAAAARIAASDAEAEIWRTKRRMVEVQARIAALSTDREDRAELGAELKRLRKSLSHSEPALPAFAERRLAAERELAGYRETLGFQPPNAGTAIPALASF